MKEKIFHRQQNLEKNNYVVDFYLNLYEVINKFIS